jgi:hypothetical protein
VPAKAHLVIGPNTADAVADLLAAKATELGAAALVVASSGKSRVQELWTGSVAQRLTRTSHVRFVLFFLRVRARCARFCVCARVCFSVFLTISATTPLFLTGAGRRAPRVMERTRAEGGESAAAAALAGDGALCLSSILLLDFSLARAAWRTHTTLAQIFVTMLVLMV